MAYTSINKPSDYFNTKLYTGDGSSPRSITGIGFQPDWVWTKNRSGTNGHVLYDSVRGASAGEISTHNTNAEGLATGYGELTSFNSDGYTFEDGETNGVVFNNSGNNYVSWNWKAGGTASSNTDGSITSTVSANTTSGFSIVSWTSSTGADTVGHGLGVTPQIVITKTRSATNNWSVHTTIIDGSNDYLFLNTTGASGNSSYSVPTSSIFNFNYGSSTDFISYVFAEKKGFSKFGSYTGNGSSDGPMIYTGFKPAWVMIKRTNSATPWCMWDNKRNTFNLTQNYLYANDSGAEGSGANIDMDMLSNGFKLRNSTSFLNTSGDNFIYMAFAEHPFVSSTGTPTTAR
jgi:hypothetical protein